MLASCGTSHHHEAYWAAAAQPWRGKWERSHGSSTVGSDAHRVHLVSAKTSHQMHPGCRRCTALHRDWHHQHRQDRHHPGQVPLCQRIHTAGVFLLQLQLQVLIRLLCLLQLLLLLWTCLKTDSQSTAHHVQEFLAVQNS